MKIYPLIVKKESRYVYIYTTKTKVKVKEKQTKNVTN